MDELYRIDDSPPPRRRPKLWHLSALVAASALIFEVGRTLKGSVELMGLLIGPLILMIASTTIYYAIELGNRVAQGIEDRADRLSGFERHATGFMSILAYTTILFGLPVLVLLTLAVGLAFVESCR